MTDVPRRSYPLVVPPPGGFEDAVGRGRRIRRRKAGGTTGAALALAGVVAYTSMAGGPQTAGLEQTHNPPPVQQTYGPGDADPTPFDTATPRAPDPSGTAAPTGGPATGPVTGPTSVPPGPTATAVPTQRPTRQPRPGQPYAPRPEITEHEEELAGTSACLPGELWCAYADVNVSTGATGTRYTLVYGLCRSVDATVGTVRFDRKQKVDYAAIDTRDDDDPSNDDTVWTYSAGQPVVAMEDSVTIRPGYCREWTTDWDGYDDFGYTPPAGEYILRARSLGTSDTVLPTREATFQHA